MRDVVLMMLRRLSAQQHDYNLKLTKAELMALYRLEVYMEEPGDLEHWIKIGELIKREGDRLDDASSQ